MNEQFRYPLSDDLKRLIAGENETVFRMMENRFCVEIQSRLPGLLIFPQQGGDIQGTFLFLDQLKLAAQAGTPINTRWLDRMWTHSETPTENSTTPELPQTPILRNRYGIAVFPKTKSQYRLTQSIETNDIVFAGGPAGTGKTFLATALAVARLENREVERICLVRPAVEAGESLGFLPGDLKEKIAPYLRPIQDSLAELLSPEKLKHYQETGAIEVAPLAYMRGRTLKRAFIILDEAQNTTIAQMKMFLTRLGPYSKAIITGDSTQADLSPRETSGLSHAIELLKNVKGIDTVYFEKNDVLRHRLVKEIISAYGNSYEK